MLFQIERSQMRKVKLLVRIWPGCLPGDIFLADPGHSREIASLRWPGYTLISFLKDLDILPMEKEVWASLLRWHCHHLGS